MNFSHQGIVNKRLKMTSNECQYSLRALEIDAYANIISVFRAQGHLTEDKIAVLQELAKILQIPKERHRAECRRAANDEKLTVIAEHLFGSETSKDWVSEGRRTVPLIPRLKAHTPFTTLANSMAIVGAIANEKRTPIHRVPKRPIVDSSNQEITGAKRMKMAPTETMLENDKLVEFPQRLKSSLENEPFSQQSPVPAKVLKLSSPSGSDSEVACVSGNDEKNIVSKSSSLTESDSDVTHFSEIEHQQASASVEGILASIKAQIGEIEEVDCSVPMELEIMENGSSNILEMQTMSDTENAMLCDDAQIQNEVAETIINMNKIGDVSLVSMQSNTEDSSNSNLISITCVEESLSSEQNSDNCVKTNPKIEELSNSDLHPETCVEITPNIEKSFNSNLNSDTCVEMTPKIEETVSAALMISSNDLNPSKPRCVIVSDQTVLGKVSNQQSCSSSETKEIQVPKMINPKLMEKKKTIILQKGPMSKVKLSWGGKEIFGKVIMDGKNLRLKTKEGKPIAFLQNHVSHVNGDEIMNVFTTTISTSKFNETNKKNNNNATMEFHENAKEVIEIKSGTSKMLETRFEITATDEQHSVHTRNEISENHSLELQCSSSGEISKDMSPTTSELCIINEAETGEITKNSMSAMENSHDLRTSNHSFQTTRDENSLS